MLLILTIVTLLLLIAVMVLLRYTDTPPVDDTDILHPAALVAPDSNPYPAIRSLSFTDEDTKELQRVHDMLKDPASFDDRFILRVLEKQGQVLTQFANYAAMPDWRRDQSHDDSHDYMAAWVGVSHLKLAQMKLLTQGGEPEVAVETAMSLLRFAEGVRRAGNPLEVIRMADSLSQETLKALQLTTGDARFGPEDWLLLAEGLASLDHSTHYLDAVLRTEYELAKRHLNEMRLASGQPPRPSLWSRFGFLRRALFKTNLTTAEATHFYRHLLTQRGDHLASLLQATRHGRDQLKARKSGHCLRGNFFGYQLLNLGEPEWFSPLLQHFDTQAQLTLMETMVAMQRYRLEHGQWPETLNQLVPQYLDTLPVDPMDGQPLRYHVEHRVLYSVGTDLRDQGGSSLRDDPSQTSMPDTTLTLEP